jgi:hypothetical protein
LKKWILGAQLPALLIDFFVLRSAYIALRKETEREDATASSNPYTKSF